MFPNFIMIWFSSYTVILQKRFRQTTTGISASHLANQIASIINKSKVPKTKEHYASQFRHYVNFCLDHAHDPFNLPLDSQLCMFWIQHKVNKHGNTKSLNQWTTMLNWISDLANAPKICKQNPDYKNYLSALRKQYHECHDHRLPFKLKHMHKCTQKPWTPQPGQTHHQRYTNLLKVTLANVYFFTMSRPCELLISKSTISHLSSLLILNYKRTYDNEHNIPMIELTINFYKNQVSRQIKKENVLLFHQMQIQQPMYLL